MQTSEILAIASGIAYTVAYLDYNRQVIKGATKPNGVTWLIWSVIAVVNTTSYLKATGDVWKSVIPLLNIGLCFATFLLAACLKKFERPDAIGFVALALGIIAAFVWKQYGSAKYANLIVQAAILTGFIPTWRGLLHDPTREQPRPWWTWTTGYIFALTVVILRWEGQPYDLAYPINCILLHASVPIIASRRKKALTHNQRSNLRGGASPPTPLT
jgi:hypothetical protein